MRTPITARASARSTGSSSRSRTPARRSGSRAALVVDLDLHYGNGTASLLATRPELFALSIYGNWYKDNRASPRRRRPSAPPTRTNSWSVADRRTAPTARATSRCSMSTSGRAIERAKPDVILYQAGADPYREDPYSPLDMGLEDLYERDRRVFARARSAPASRSPGCSRAATRRTSRRSSRSTRTRRGPRWTCSGSSSAAGWMRALLTAR